MNKFRLPQAALGGAFLLLCFVFLDAAPKHTTPAAGQVLLPPAERQIRDHALPIFVPNPPKPPSVEEQFFFQSANRERAEEGLPQLKWDEPLAAAARKHAALMADKNELSHRLSGEAALEQRTVQAGARFSMVGENVAIGPDSSVIHIGWMHSPGHRANILSANFNALGVGVVERDGQLYAVEDFSRAVQNLTLDQQEKQVGAMLTARGYHLSQSREDTKEARNICEAGSPRHASVHSPHQNMQILQFETPDLSNLPTQLDQSLRNNAYRNAAVGACEQAKSENSLPRFRLVILLFTQAG